MDRQTVFSAIQPTGKITIGNYLGSLVNWMPMQETHDCIFCVADMHSITVEQTPSLLRKNTLELIALYLACGLNPDKSIIFVQSHVAAHAELTWVLDTISYLGELSRMTQFKDKSRRHASNINMGLMNYPVLMAADILLYGAHLVPVGKDQLQHLELARDIATRFNNKYSPTFVVPDGYVSKTGKKIMSLADPAMKMSKSDDNENGYVCITEDEDVIRRKLKRAVTDSETDIYYDPAKKPAVSNLLAIYSLMSNVSIDQAVSDLSGKGYAELKQAVADSIVARVAPIRQEQQRILADKAYLESVIKDGADKAEHLARQTLSKVYRKVGFVPRIR